MVILCLYHRVSFFLAVANTHILTVKIAKKRVFVCICKIFGGKLLRIVFACAT